MELLVRNAEGNLSKKDREYAAKKLGKLDRYFHAAQRVEMVHREGKLDHRIEITVFADGLTLRGEEADGSVQAAIDKVADKMENRLRRLKSRIVKSHRHKGTAVPNGIAEEDGHDHEEPKLVERKRVSVKPMSVEEAGLQMEMVGHPFYLFKNAEDDQLHVIYKRHDGQYGLLTPEG
jgi:putative sigma-54 modulation protein